MIKNVILIFSLFLFSWTLTAQEANQVEIKNIPVSEGIYMLEGGGGNIAVSVGEDGVIMIDSQLAELSDPILEAVKSLTDKPLRFLINTHWHFDHTGGNENIGKTGAIIVAHENVRRSLEKGQFFKSFGMDIPPAVPEALPVVTFAGEMTFHWNNENIKIYHPGRAHTNGDAIIYFQKANVLHTGDLFFNGLYPFIDKESGGYMPGLLRSLKKILALIDDETKIIPGHGPLADKADLEAYTKMLSTVYYRIKTYMKQGLTAEEIVARKPTSDFDAQWGNGFLKPDQWVQIIVDLLTH